MPYRRPHPCTQPGGCPNLAEPGGSRCRAHARVYSVNRGSAPSRGYDRHYLKLRRLCFIRDRFTCVDCGWKPDILREWEEAQVATPGTLNDLPPIATVFAELLDKFHSGDIHLHCDHITPIESRPDLRLDLDNLQCLCQKCHSKKGLKYSLQRA